MEDILFGFDRVLENIHDGILLVLIEHIVFVSVSEELSGSIAGVFRDFFSDFLSALFVGLIEIVQLFVEVGI